MDRARDIYDMVRGASMMRVASVLMLAAISALIVYSVMAAPGGSPWRGPQGAPSGGWGDESDYPDWTPISTSTDIDPLEVVIPHHIEKQHLFVSRVRVRNPEFEGLYALDGEGDVIYLRGGAADLTFHAVTDLVGVVPRGRYYIGETGSGESSNWLVDYEDLPLLIRTNERDQQVCVKPWNWFQQGQRDAFLEIGHGESGYHVYSWPAAWRLPFSDTSYPGIEPTSLHSQYSAENKPYVFGHDRDEMFMREGASVLFRDVGAHSVDMPGSVNLASLCGDGEVWREYSDNSLYRTYLDSNPGRYEWRFAGMSVNWVYVDPDKFDLDHVPYAELPSGTVVVSPEMVYSDTWPRMGHPTLEDSEKLHVFSVLDKGTDDGDRSFRRLPESARGDIDDVYGDGRVEVIESSINPEDVCGEFTVQINAIEYTPTYVAGGVEAHCLGVGANYNHLPFLIRDTRVASMHPFFEADDETGECDPDKSGQVTRECFDVNVGVEGRVVQREDVYVYLYYRIYEQRYVDGGGWQDLDPDRDELVRTNDPALEGDGAYHNVEVRLNYVDPGDIGNCDYRPSGHSLFDQRPDDKYVGAFKVDLPSAYRVSDEDTRKKRFGVYLEVDMVHQIEIGGTEPGKDYRIHSGSYDAPACDASRLQVEDGLWNYSERKFCPDNSENCELWMGPPAKWKSFDLFQPTVTPAPVR